MAEERGPNTQISIEAQIDRVRTWIGADIGLRRLYDAAIARLDRERNADLVRRYGATIGFGGALKFLDCAYWIYHRLLIARERQLDRQTGLRILDLEPAGGHFCFVCDVLGHEALGVGPADPLYRELDDLLGIDRIEHRISTTERLPYLGRRFDLITAYGVQFDAMTQDQVWTAADWHRFIEDLVLNQVQVPGEIGFSLERLWDPAFGSWVPKDQVGEVFREYGGSGDGFSVALNIGRLIYDQVVRDRIGAELGDYFDRFPSEGPRAALGFCGDYYLIRLMFHLLGQADAFVAVGAAASETLGLVERHFSLPCFGDIPPDQPDAARLRRGLYWLGASRPGEGALLRTAIAHASRASDGFCIAVAGRDDLAASGPTREKPYQVVRPTYTLSTSLHREPARWKLIAAGDWDLLPEGLESQYELPRTREAEIA